MEGGLEGNNHGLIYLKGMKHTTEISVKTAISWLRFELTTSLIQGWSITTIYSLPGLKLSQHLCQKMFWWPLEKLQSHGGRGHIPTVENDALKHSNVCTSYFNIKKLNIFLTSCIYVSCILRINCNYLPKQH